MEHIKGLLSKRIRQSGLASQVSTALIIKEFDDYIRENLGQAVAKKVKPLYIKDKILTVACLSSVVVQEMRFKKAEILKLINQKFGKDAIKEIKFIV